MAREERDREDLLREATALVERVELAVSPWAEHFTAGFRQSGSVSLYFGPDPVYHFNAAGQLRRAFVAGLLYRADHGRLASLRRERTAERVALVRHELSPCETQAFLVLLNTRRQEVVAAIESGDYRIVGQVPPEVDVLSRVRKWLAALPDNIEIARSPRVA
jgi:hypothetical protein